MQVWHDDHTHFEHGHAGLSMHGLGCKGKSPPRTGNVLWARLESLSNPDQTAIANIGQEAGGVNLLFHTNTESGKTDDLAADPHINISFLNSSGEWASVSGTAEILTDRSLVKKYYAPSLKAWVGDLGDGKHDGGPDDPRIGVILVKAKTITYAISPSSTVVGRGAQVVKGMVTGEAAQVHKLREVSEEDLLQCKFFHSAEASLTRSGRKVSETAQL